MTLTVRESISQASPRIPPTCDCVMLFVVIGLAVRSLECPLEDMQIFLPFVSLCYLQVMVETCSCVISKL